jgi:type I restriction-modification system DNA methylase subunit
VSKKPVSDVFQHYLSELKKSVSKGDYTEMTLRTPLENFIKGLSPDFDVTHEAKRLKELGAPDFTAYRSAVNVGYIEAKDLGKNLDEELESKQLKKYRESIDNIILTDYRRFILIRGNQAIFDQSLFRLADLDDPKSSVRNNKIDEFVQLIDTFFGYSQPTIRSAKVLAQELAKKTKLLKDLASEQLEEDLEKVGQGVSPSPLYDFYEALNELIKEISIEDCADAYAQTIAYGLFLAKINEKGTLDRDTAASHIPRNIKIIRKIFSSIAGDSLPSNVSWIVDALIKILNASQTDEILSEIDFRGKKDRDPFTFFYEDFLASYEPKKKKRLGVYYTPRPVVSFIVKSVNQILKDDFDKPMGFAEEGLTVLDPAVGTGTFLWLVYLSTLVELKDRGLGGLISGKIKNHILRDFYGFELLITPYIIAHLKLTTVLKKWFYEFDDEDRIQTYLTNTLEPFETHTHIPFFRELTEESETADALKIEKPILVVLGNPPYSVSSANKSKWIAERMGDYKRDLDERNIQPLDDDYIKFIRFAQWKVEQNGEGIVAFITNNRYLDGAIHRQMRKSLLSAFNRIYILNLHGSARRTLDAGANQKDENVFDIQQGVSICIFVKNKASAEKEAFYSEFWGSRDEKYASLDRNTVSTIAWHIVHPKHPHYFFVPKDLTLQDSYLKFKALNEIFQSYSTGVKTHRDNLVVAFTESELAERMEFLQSDASDDEVRKRFRLHDTTDWSLKEAREAFRRFDYSKHVEDYYYRPFDQRKICYTSLLIDRPREHVMRNMLHENTKSHANVGLISSKLLSGDEFGHAFVTSNLAYIIGISPRTSETAYLFPLYLLDNVEKAIKSSKKAENDEQKILRSPNFTTQFSEFIKQQYAPFTVTPEQILGYIYAILYSPTYRSAYNEFLKMDFPRINFVKNYEVFVNISDIGRALIDLHLMTTKLKTNVTFDVAGTNAVKLVKYQEGRAYINEAQYFDGIPEGVWNFYIGGYQVLDKWLKSRKGRELSSIEIEHFLQVVEVIKKTIKFMKEIDGLTHF